MNISEIKVYEDNAIIVVNKPAGVPVQTAAVGVKSLETLLKAYRKEKGEEPEIYVVHRLDQPVSGLLVFAKTKSAAAFLSKELTKDSFSKIYEAKVYQGTEFKEKEELVDYLIKDTKTNMSRVCEKNTKGAKEAKLIYEVLMEEGKTLKLRINLFTGRHHQIRVQLAHRGLPILGDLKYGSEESVSYSKEMYIKNLMLTAVDLKFKHPASGNDMHFSL